MSTTARRRRAGRAVAAGAGVAALAVCALAGWATGESAVGWLSLMLAVAVALAAAGLRFRDLARRRRRFETELSGSLETARARLDVDSLRVLRTSRGDSVTARAIQKQLPQLTIGQIAELVASL